MSEAETTFIDMAIVERILSEHKSDQWPLIPALQDIQNEVGYIPPEAVDSIAKAFGLFSCQVQGVISFYSQLHTEPRGKNIVRVCRGTACHVRGGKTILKLVKQHLALEEGQTTPDLEYTLETVACIGVCAMAPNLMIGKQTYGHLNPKRVGLLLSDSNMTRG